MNETQRNRILDTAREVLQNESEALLRIKEKLNGEFVAAVEIILACNGKVILTGIGKSGIIAKKIAATLASTGTPSFYLNPSEAFHGDLGMISKEDVVIALSHSGETDEVLKIVPFIHENGNKLIALTGNV
jgi:arabinose-5-phosphate isomerase